MSEKKSKYKMIPVIFALAWPTMLEEFMQTAVQYIDTAMVGSLGTLATAAVGSTSTVNWLIGSSISAIGIGFLSYIARSFGAGDKESARRASAQAVLAVIISGIIFTILTTVLSPYVPVWMQVDESIKETASTYFLIIYAPMLPRAASIIFGTVLRGAGDTKTPMVCGVIVNIINVILNFFLIYETRMINVFGLEFKMLGAGLGVIGAALASAIAFTVGGILITIAVFRHPTVSPKGYSLKPNPDVLRPCMKVAIPNMFQRFTTSLGYVVFASMINSLGDVATAAHTIANTVESAFYIPGYGMQSAAATLAGNTLGARDKKRMNELTTMIIIVEVLMMIVTGGLLFVFAPEMMRLFTDDSEVIGLGTTVLRMVALSEPIFGVAIVIEGIMQGVGKTVTPFVFNVIGMWGIRIVGTFICTTFFSLGLVSAWACMIAHNIVLFFMFLVHWKRGKWMAEIDNNLGE